MRANAKCKKSKIMDRYYERQTEMLCFLNDSCIEPTTDLESAMEIIGIKFIDAENGWYIPDE